MSGSNGTSMRIFNPACGKPETYHMTNPYDMNRLKRTHTGTSKYYKFVGKDYPSMSGEYVHISDAAGILHINYVLP